MRYYYSLFLLFLSSVNWLHGVEPPTTRITFTSAEVTHLYGSGHPTGVSLGDSVVFTAEFNEEGISVDSTHLADSGNIHRITTTDGTKVCWEMAQPSEYTISYGSGYSRSGTFTHIVILDDNGHFPEHDVIYFVNQTNTVFEIKQSTGNYKNGISSDLRYELSDIESANFSHSFYWGDTSSWGTYHYDYTTPSEVILVSLEYDLPIVYLQPLYESNTNASIDIVAVPSVGDPSDFTYQWYLNDTAIPSEQGGSSSTYTIHGSAVNEGTWQVVVTGANGSITKAFEYRVFVDTDNDGLSDYREVNITTTAPDNADSDTDGLNDGDEVNIHSTDPNNPDSDGDGLNDGDEVNIHSTNPNRSDSDEDGLSDGDEVNIHSTNPNNRDSDGDGLRDKAEINIHSTDPNDADSDNDGLNDSAEVRTHSTDPNNFDTDNDGFLDGAEINTHSTDPNDLTDHPVDPDNDGLIDEDEINIHSTDPNDTDSDDDGLRDGYEVNVYGTDPNNADSDDDGLLDGEEVNTYSTDPQDSDSDNDGLLDGEEVNTYATSPNNPDSDDDGLDDNEEVNTYSTDPNDSDSDDDSLSDGDEVNTLFTDPNVSDADLTEYFKEKTKGLSLGRPVISIDPTTGDLIILIGLKKSKNLAEAWQDVNLEEADVTLNDGEIQISIPNPEQSLFYKVYGKESDALGDN